MVELEVPPEPYYQELRKDLESRHPKADWHVLDHVVSLEAFLDVSILSGFSFGTSKAKLMVNNGPLLGRIVSREGIAPDEDRAQAIRDFGPLKTLQQLQQFAGSTN